MSIYEKIKEVFKTKNIEFSEKEHNDEGHGVNIAQIHEIDEKFGAKALVLKLKYHDDKSKNQNDMTKKPEYCLAILSFADKIDTNQITKYFGAKKAPFASRDESKQITECEPGAIPPFSFNISLPVIIDNQISTFPKIFFNAGRLDRSICMNIEDYLMVVNDSKIKYDFIPITKNEVRDDSFINMKH